VHFQSTNVAPVDLQQLYNFPPAVSSGGLQSYTDPIGDLWVAMPGVYGGTWQRASNVLLCRNYRVAAFTVTPAAQALIMDTIAYDNYNMLDNTTGHLNFIIPGIYLIYAHVNAVPVLVGDTVRLDILHNGAVNQSLTAAQGSTSGGGGPNLTSHAVLQVNSNGGSDYYTFQTANPGVGASASLTGTPNYWHTYMTCAYMGRYP